VVKIHVYLLLSNNNECYKFAEDIILKTGGLINYLKKSDIKGEKFRDLEATNNK
jgi:hypothetical protein